MCGAAMLNTVFDRVPEVKSGQDARQSVLFSRLHEAAVGSQYRCRVGARESRRQRQAACAERDVVRVEEPFENVRRGSALDAVPRVMVWNRRRRGERRPHRIRDAIGMAVVIRFSDGCHRPPEVVAVPGGERCHIAVRQVEQAEQPRVLPQIGRVAGAGRGSDADGRPPGLQRSLGSTGDDRSDCG